MMRASSSPFLLLASLVLLMSTVALLPAAEPIVWRTDYPSARKEAEKKKLPILVVIGTQNCTYCRKMDAATFADPAVAAAITAGYIPLKIDADKEPEFVRAMKVAVYPTTVIAGPEGKVYAFLAGYVGPEQFTENSTKVLAMIPGVGKADAVASKGAAAAALTARGKSGDLPAGRAGDWLSVARDLQKAGRVGECLERCEAVVLNFPKSIESEEAAGIAAGIKADTEKLTAAAEQLDERTAATYVALAEAWVQKGNLQQASACYEKALKLAGPGRTADAIQEKLGTLAVKVGK